MQRTKRSSTVYHEKTYKSYILRRVTKSLKSLPLKGKQQFSKDIQKWIDHNGKAYTVKRLKDIKQIVLSSYSEFHTTGRVPIINQTQFKSSISVRTDRRILSGYLGDMQRASLYSPKVLEQFLQLLHAYTLIIDEGTSPNDIKELLDIIEPRPSLDHQTYIDKFCSDVKGTKLQKFVNDSLKNVQVFNEVYNLVDGKATKQVNVEEKDYTYLLRKPMGFPEHYSLKQPSQAHENELFFYDFVKFSKSELAWKIHKLMPTLWENSFPRAWFLKGGYQFYAVGQMNLLNEGGLKKRWVENTAPVIQHIVQPLGKRLYDLVKYMPWDCTFNENKGIKTIQNRLDKGEYCYSVDLSKATDKLPMDYNMSILKKLFTRIPDGQTHLEIFNLIAKAHVLLPDISKEYPNYKGPIYTRWGTGQPMGAYPSFAMLTLVHGLILFILNGYEYNDDFVVHGDDVVILNDTLFSKYTDFLESSGMEYSPYKTISGTKFAEMNSKIILSDRVLSPVKWKEINSRNVLDLAPFWGVELCSILAENKNYTRKVVEDVLALPYPLGSGLNPKGLSLEARLSNFPGLVDSLLQESETQDYYDSFRDLVLSRYSKFATINGEIDYGFYLALLHDLELADAADRHACQVNSEVIPKDFWGLDSRWLNILFLSGNARTLKDKCSKIQLLTNTKRRKKELKLRFENVASFHTLCQWK